MGECKYSSTHSQNRLRMEASGKQENNPRCLTYTDRIDPRSGLNGGRIRSLYCCRSLTQISGCQHHGRVTLPTEQLCIHSLTWQLLATVKCPLAMHVSDISFSLVHSEHWRTTPSTSVKSLVQNYWLFWKSFKGPSSAQITDTWPPGD
jgi:hypothetical protein